MCSLDRAYSEAAARILTAARADGRAWDRLTEMTDTFGHRLSGSEALEAAHPLDRRADEERTAWRTSAWSR